ncbi:hypothetical protein [Paenibacillus alkalitolerans]|uniref:hypothetical protein n=1 Tax=Paenibacillus alkalitolerans TaxID=2799335 RepID=UPI0018F324A4|nr:hypothetical protein [Paenibacillus alkalitolerans]
MKIHLVVLCLVILIVGCKDGNDTSKLFSEVRDGLANNLEQLNSEQGIIMSGFSSDQSQKQLKIGIEIDRDKISNEELKQIVESYLKSSISMTSETDWRELLLPFTLIIEEIGDGKSLILAEKLPNTAEIIWH